MPEQLTAATLERLGEPKSLGQRWYRAGWGRGRTPGATAADAAAYGGKGGGSYVRGPGRPSPTPSRFGVDAHH